MAKVHWIKITVNMFDDEKIKLIESLPQGDTIIVIWQKLICLAGKINMNGYIFLSENIPYTDEMLSITFSRPLPIIRLALKTFSNFNMIEIDSKGLIYLPNFEKHQNISGLEKIRLQTNERVKNHREKSKLLLNQGKKINVTKNVTESNATDIDIEVDKEEEKNKDIVHFDFEKVWNLYPKKFGKKQSEKHFKASVKTEQDYNELTKAINNYNEQIKQNKTEDKYIKHGSTFFNNWRDYVNIEIKPTRRNNLQEIQPKQTY